MIRKKKRVILPIIKFKNKKTAKKVAKIIRSLGYKSVRVTKLKK